jgi:DHA3 family macrolide efflux protein-like MFS transporter
MPAVNALLPQIAPPEKLIKVNGINSTIQPFIMIAAPVASGALLSFYRLESIFFIDVVTALVAISLLLVLKVPAHQKAHTLQANGYFDDLKAGLAYLGQNQVIKTLFVFFAATFFLVAPVAFLSPLLVARSFGEEVWRLTANEVTFFLGSIVGGAVMTVWGGFKNHFRTIGLATILFGLFFSGLGLAKDFVLYLTIMFLSGFPMSMFSVPTTTLLQETVPPDMQGRVFGVMQLIQTTLLPAGMLVFGPIADLITIELLLVLTGTTMVIPGLWIFFNRQFVRTQPNLASAD